MKLTKEKARWIARDAYDECVSYSITDYVGYYTIWSNDECDYSVAINKECDDNGNDQHYAINISCSTEETWWEYTNTLDVDELVDMLMQIVSDIDHYEGGRQ